MLYNNVRLVESDSYSETHSRWTRQCMGLKRRLNINIGVTGALGSGDRVSVSYKQVGLFCISPIDMVHYILVHYIPLEMEIKIIMNQLNR